MKLPRHSRNGIEAQLERNRRRIERIRWSCNDPTGAAPAGMPVAERGGNR